MSSTINYSKTVQDDNALLTPLPGSIAEVREAAKVLEERGVTQFSADYHELLDLPDRMLRWGPDSLFMFRHDDLRRVGVLPAMGNFPAEMFVKMGFSGMAGLPIPFEEAGNILRFQKNQFFTSDPHIHDPVKRIFAQPWMPKEMPPFHAMGEAITNALIELVDGVGEINLCGDFTIVLAMRFWGEVLEMTPEEQKGLIKAMEKMSPITSGTDHTVEGLKRLNDEAFPEYWRNLVPPIRRARESGRHQFLNRIAMQFSKLAVDIPEGIPEDVDMFMACNMIDAFHAVAGGTACAIYQLLVNPEVYAAVRENPELAPKVVAESLRLYPQVPLTSRYVREDIEFDGLLIPTGSKVSLYWAAANRDPAVFDSPNTFDIHRDQRPALTFGNGAQICPGRNVAQTLAIAAIKALTRPGVSIALSGGECQWVPQGMAPATSPIRIPVTIQRL